MPKGLLHPVTSKIMMTQFHLSADNSINFTHHVKKIYNRINSESMLLI